MLRVTNDGGDFQVEVLLLSEVRGPASVAQTLYRETEASQELRLKVAAERKAMKQFEELPTGRPSKRDRRKIIQFRGRACRRMRANPEVISGYSNRAITSRSPTNRPEPCWQMATAQLGQTFVSLLCINPIVAAQSSRPPPSM